MITSNEMSDSAKCQRIEKEDEEIKKKRGPDEIWVMARIKLDMRITRNTTVQGVINRLGSELKVVANDVNNKGKHPRQLKRTDILCDVVGNADNEETVFITQPDEDVMEENPEYYRDCPQGEYLPWLDWIGVKWIIGRDDCDDMLPTYGNCQKCLTMGPLGGICRRCQYFFVAYRTRRGRKVINSEVVFKTVGGNDDRDLLGRRMYYKEKYVFVRPLDEKHPQFKNLDEEAAELIARLLSTAPDY